jgi:hypothetical protein
VSDDVLIAVDPHKASNTAAVLDPVSKTVIEAARFANTIDGYAQLRAFAVRWSQRRWAVEGCHGAGRSLAQRLTADGEAVLDVPAKLAARVRVYSRGHGRKTGIHQPVRQLRQPVDWPASGHALGVSRQQGWERCLPCAAWIVSSFIRACATRPLRRAISVQVMRLSNGKKMRAQASNPCGTIMRT